MIAAGSGIAPFRSFWQERQRQAQVGHDPSIIVSLSNKKPCLSSLHVQTTWALGQAQVGHDPPIIVIFDVSLSNKKHSLRSFHVQTTWALGPTVLLFGCRRESMDLLRKETDKFRFFFFFFCQQSSFCHPVVIRVQ